MSLVYAINDFLSSLEEGPFRCNNPKKPNCQNEGKVGYCKNRHCRHLERTSSVKKGRRGKILFNPKNLNAIRILMWSEP